MSGSLYNAVAGYIKSGRARFHMPGHKGRGDGILAPVFLWDITEVDGADSLFEASGALLELERELAKAYGSARTLLSTGGSTLCIQAMLALACKPGGSVIMGRGAHRAAVNAAALLDLRAVWVYPDDSAGEWFSGRYAPCDVRRALDEHQDAAAVYITSPDYFGVMSDIPALARLCRERGKALLVDNAHGAHLRFLPGSPHPMAQGAAMCSDSLHKSLCAMTGGAALHIARDHASYCENAKRLMALFGSSSPSYPIMLSCESAVEKIRAGKTGALRASQSVARLRELAAGLGFAVPRGVMDEWKLSICFAPLKIDAADAAAVIRQNGVEPEYISETACVFMASPNNGADDFARLERAVRALGNLGGSEGDCRAACGADAFIHAKAALTIREATFAPRETVKTPQAAGRIAADMVAPCPPGIPVLIAGEKIDAQCAALLTRLGIENVSVIIE